VVRITSGSVRRVATVTAALAAIACLVAACSSPRKSPAADPSTTNPATQALAYSKCMQTHGVPNFPDPKITHNGNGTGISMGVGARGDLNPANPAFKRASRACRKLQPAGQTQPQQTPQELATDVKFADCMRAHGFPSFPDPDSKGAFSIPGSINPSSSQFQSVTRTCQSKTHIHVLTMGQRNPGGGS
jgi:hypothetical protein